VKVANPEAVQFAGKGRLNDNSISVAYRGMFQDTSNDPKSGLEASQFPRP
jgi:hypothetical protein